MPCQPFHSNDFVPLAVSRVLDSQGFALTVPHMRVLDSQGFALTVPHMLVLGRSGECTHHCRIV